MLTWRGVCVVSCVLWSDGQPLDVWIGLQGTAQNTTGATVFSWADQSPVTFTYWGPDQPSRPTQDPSCVFYSGEVCVCVCVCVCVGVQ